METPAHIADQRLLGGHPALDFVNLADAEGRPEPFEALRSYQDLVAWAHRAGIVAEGAADRLLSEASNRSTEATAIHRRSLFLRGEMDRVFRAIATGEIPPRVALRHLRDAQAEALSHAELVPQEAGRFTWSWPETTELDAVLWPVVHAATELMTSGNLERIKLCAGCPWLFIDSSKNHSRRWCSMEDGCGSEAKMRNYVARRAARKRAG